MYTASLGLAQIITPKTPTREISMKNTKVKRNESGTIHLSVETEWLDSSGEAVSVANSLIELEIDATTSEIESRGGRVVGTTSYSVSVSEKEEADITLYQGSTEADIDWVVDDKEKRIFEKRRYINIEEELKNLLRTRVGKVCYPNPPPTNPNFPRTFLCFWDVVGIERLEFISKEGKVLESEYKPIPDGITQERKELINCTSDDQNETFTVQMSSERGEKLTLSTAIESKTDISIGLKYSVLNAGASKTQNVKITNTFEQTFKEVIARTQTSTKKVRSHKLLLVNSILKQSRGNWPFIATVIVDGWLQRNVALCTDSSGNSCGPAKVMAHQKASEFLSEDERTFTINGVFENAEVSDIKIVYLEKDVDPNDTTICPWPNIVYQRAVSDGFI